MNTIFTRTFDEGIFYIDKAFTLTPSRIAELHGILKLKETINEFTGDDKYYVVLAWPELFDPSMVNAAVNAAIHCLPVPFDFWYTKTGKQVIKMYNGPGKAVDGECMEAFNEWLDKQKYTKEQQDILKES